MKATLSASQSLNLNHFFSKIAYRIFMKFQTSFWFFKDKKVIQPGKNLISGKRPEVSLKVRLFGVGKKFVQFVPFHFPVYMMHHSYLYDSAETTCFGKTSFLSYIRKCSQPIRLPDFLSFNITKTIWGIIFLYECS